MARKFNFNLKPVLRLREMIEEQKKKDFALANRAVNEEQLRRQGMLEDREKTQENVREIYAKDGNFDQIVDMYRYINSLDLQLTQNNHKLSELNKIREEKRQILTAAQKNRKALELLRDNRHQTYLQKCTREQQIKLDALAIQARQHSEQE